jgi:hypothetical protein
MCGDAGWALDGAPSKSPMMLELIPCPLPDCTASGRDVEHVALAGLGLTRAVVAGGIVVAVGR